MAYTAEDFERLALCVGWRQDAIDDAVPNNTAIFAAALRIAANVVRPGRIENEIIHGRFGTIGYEADAIRKALTDA